MADLSTLMQMSPYATGVMAGQSHGQEMNKTRLDQQSLAQLMQHRELEQSQKSAMQPLELEAKRIANMKGMAEIPGIETKNEKEALALDLARKTQDSTIASTNFANEEKLRKGASALLGQTAKQLEGVPDIERPSVFMNSLRNAGVPEKIAQQMAKQFQSIPPSQLPKALEAARQAMLRDTPEYAKEMDKEGLQQKGATERQRISSGATIRAAEIGAESRSQIQQMKSQGDAQLNTLLKQRNFSGAAAAAASIAMFMPDGSPDKAKYEQLATTFAAQALAEKQASSTGNSIDMPGVSGLPAAPTNNPMARPPGAGVPNPPQPGKQKHSLAEVTKMYPGVPAEKVREAYKKKFGVDLQ